ncbi:MAG: nucleotide exchange factor GrpE [Acidimicrobiales bacterium]
MSSPPTGAEGSGGDPVVQGVPEPDDDLSGGAVPPSTDDAHAEHDPGLSADEGSESDEALAQAAAAVEADIAAVISERDDYLDNLRRVQADFENFKKQTIRRNTDLVERAAEGLAAKLLPVLDACDAALAHGATDVKPIHDALLDVLAKEGLQPLRPEGEPFDPNHHEAVVHEPVGDDDEPGPVVTDVLRAGYLWKGRVLRPAMVKVRG